MRRSHGGGRLGRDDTVMVLGVMGMQENGGGAGAGGGVRNERGGAGGGERNEGVVPEKERETMGVVPVEEMHAGIRGCSKLSAAH